MSVRQTAARKRQEDDVLRFSSRQTRRWCAIRLSESAMDISVVEADTHSVGKERASTSVFAVVVSVSDGGRVSLHVRDSSPMSNRKTAHARGVMHKVRRIDLCTHFKLRSPNGVCFVLPLVFHWKMSSSMLDLFRPYVLTFCDLVALRLSLQYSLSIVLILDEVQSLEIRFLHYIELLTLNIHHYYGVLRSSMTLSVSCSLMHLW